MAADDQGDDITIGEKNVCPGWGTELVGAADQDNNDAYNTHYVLLAKTENLSGGGRFVNGVIGNGVNGGWGLVGLGGDFDDSHDLRRADGGVYGEGAVGDGVYGYSRDGRGVVGESENNDGARGESDQGVGVFGLSSSFTNAAVQGTSRPPAGGPPEGVNPEDVHPTGVFGIAGAYDPDNNYTVDNGVGVRGITLSAEADPRSLGAHGLLGEAPNAGNGVTGYANTGRGVHGTSNANDGVRGSSDQGVGVFGETNSDAYPAIQGDGAGAEGVLGLSNGASGVRGAGLTGVTGEGSAIDGFGVVGRNSGGGTGVRGESDGIGVQGLSGNDAGVEGYSEGGFGVRALGGAVGVAGSSLRGYGGVFEGPQAPVRLAPAQTAGSPTAGQHDIGELYVDSNGALYYCRNAGTPGRWVTVVP
jgi:hypothetical protein